MNSQLGYCGVVGRGHGVQHKAKDLGGGRTRESPGLGPDRSGGTLARRGWGPVPKTQGTSLSWRAFRARCPLSDARMTDHL